MPLASRRNRRPKICVCPVVSAGVDAVAIAVTATFGEDFADVECSPPATGVVGPLAVGILVTLDDVIQDLVRLDFAITPPSFRLVFNDILLSGHLVVTIASRYRGVIGTDGGFLAPCVLEFDIS